MRFTGSPDGPFTVQIRRDEFEQAISTMIGQTEMLLQTALENANLKPSDIDHILLVGGSTRVPCVKDSLRRIFGREPHPGMASPECFSNGAAISCALALAGRTKQCGREVFPPFDID